MKAHSNSRTTATILSRETLTCVIRHYFATGCCFAALVFLSPLSAQPLTTPDHAIFSPPTGKQTGLLQGYSVAISGNYRLTGCPRDPVGGGNSGSNVGSVKVYWKDGSYLYQLQRSDAMVNDGFGSCLSASGNLVAVGAPGKTVSGKTGVGLIYIYDVASPGAPVAVISPPSAVEGLGFGTTLAFGGNTLTVGLPLATTAGKLKAGSVLVYDISNLSAPTLRYTLTKPTPVSGDQFGFSVAIDGSKVVVGAPYTSTTSGSTVRRSVGQAFVFNLGGNSPDQVYLTLNNSNEKPALVENDCYGYSVGISGSLVIVGAVYGGDNSGAVYAYKIDSGNPTTKVTTMVDPQVKGPSGSGSFGACLAVSGTYVVVGAPLEALNGKQRTGSVFAFDVNRAAPYYVSTLDNPVSNPTYGYLGSSVALSGGVALAGVPYDDTEGDDAGLAYQFSVGSSAASYTFKATSPSEGDRFGTAVATARGVIAIGAPADPTAGSGEGSVRVYGSGATSASWTIYPPTADLPKVSNFGQAIAMSGKRIAVSANYLENGYGIGIIYIYDTDDHKTSPLYVLKNPDPATMGFIGGALAISGNRVLVGAYYPATHSGGAVVFELGSPTPWATLVNPVQSDGDLFGTALDIEGDNVVIGSPGRIGGGGIYIYNVGAQAPDRAFVKTTILNPFPQTNSRFGASLALNGNRLVVGAPSHTINGITGRSYLLDLSSNTPGSPILTFVNPNYGGNYGISLQLSGDLLVVGAPDDSSEAEGTGRGYLYSLASQTPTVPIGVLKNPTPGRQERFGSGLALDGNLLISSAPQESTIASLKGAAYVYFLAGSLEVIAAPLAGGSVSGGGIYPLGSPQTITAYPTLGWEFFKWNDGLATPTRTVAVPPPGNVFAAIFRPVDYPAWNTFYFTPEQNSNPAFSGPTAMPFSDGVPNLLKFFFNIPPSGPLTASDRSSLPTVGFVTITGTTYQTLTFRQSRLAANMVVTLQQIPGSGGNSWETIVPNQTTTVTDHSTGDVTVTMRIATAGVSHRILRLAVSLPPS